MTESKGLLILTADDVMLLVNEGDIAYGKSLFSQGSTPISFSLAFQLIGLLQRRSLVDLTAKYVSEIGGMFTLLQHIKYGFEQEEYLNAAVTGILGVKGKNITREVFFEEKEKQTKAYNLSGTIRLSLSEIASWVNDHPAGFLHSDNLSNEINSYSDAVILELKEIFLKKENTILMKDLRTLELLSKPAPWNEIRNVMKNLSNSQSIRTIPSVKNYVHSVEKDLMEHRSDLMDLGKRLQKIKSRENHNFEKLKKTQPLIYDFEQLKRKNRKPRKLWLWGWSSADTWYEFKSNKTDLILLRIRFEIGKIFPEHKLAISPKEYEYKCLELLERNSSHTFHSKIYYDLFMFLHVQSGSESISYFEKCVNLTASYANGYQLKQRMTSLIGGIKKQENSQAYSNCADWVKQNYGEKFFKSLDIF